MQLTAHPFAKYFTQSEFFQVELSDSALTFSAHGQELQLPFVSWTGQVTAKRGFYWGQLVFQGYPQDNEVKSWVVQGLPWENCQIFAEQAVVQYKQWYAEQVERLQAHLPRWEKELTALVAAASFLPRSSMSQWHEQVISDFQTLKMTLQQADRLLPEKMSLIKKWLNEPEQAMQQRNQQWINQQKKHNQSLFDSFPLCRLDTFQQEALLYQDDQNFVIGSAGTGKTSLLIAKAWYLINCQQLFPDQILILASHKDAVDSIRHKLTLCLGEIADHIQVTTLVDFGLETIRSANQLPTPPQLVDHTFTSQRVSEWVAHHIPNSALYSDWQAHFLQWSISDMRGEVDLFDPAVQHKISQWLVKQLQALCQNHDSYSHLQSLLLHHQEYDRLHSELSLVWPCYQAWGHHLSQEGRIDPSIVIEQANQIFEQHPHVLNFQTILLDDFQDLSGRECELLEHICSASSADKQCSLFAVGNDWQTVIQHNKQYADMVNAFQHYFTGAYIQSLPHTYRFAQPIGEIANRFIEKNPQLQNKPLHCIPQHDQLACTFARRAEIATVLSSLDQHYTHANAQVLCLIRDLQDWPAEFEQWQANFKHLTLTCMTITQSRGFEADYVLIFDLDAGTFPLHKSQQHLDTMLMTWDEPIMHAHERRLLYLGLTRARQHVWLIYQGAPSVFLREIAHDNALPHNFD